MLPLHCPATSVKLYLQQPTHGVKVLFEQSIVVIGQVKPLDKCPPRAVFVYSQHITHTFHMPLKEIEGFSKSSKIYYISQYPQPRKSIESI